MKNVEKMERQVLNIWVGMMSYLQLEKYKLKSMNETPLATNWALRDAMKAFDLLVYS